ncbi:ABC transporter ATP-binding protein [Streptomyces longisporus]|uniref:ABC transporter ATP-binding protein n=1 Tax=Streptomyces longisporus TaxID=1948 RepID=A0ABP5Z4Y7_STRLO
MPVSDVSGGQKAAGESAGPEEGGIRRRTPPIAVLAGEMLAMDRLGTLCLSGLVTLAAVLPASLAVTSGALAGRLATSHGKDLFDGGGGAAALALGGVFLLMQVVPPLAQAVAESLGRRLHRGLAERVLTALERPADLGRLEEARTRELVSAADRGLNGTCVRDAVVGAVNVGIARGGAASGVLILLAYRWWLAVLLALAYGYAMVIVSRMYQRALESAEGTPALMRRAMYLKNTLCGVSAGKEVRTFGLTDWLLDRYTTEWRKAIATTRGDRAGAARVSLVSGVVVLAAQGLAFALLVADAVDGRVGVGSFVMFAVAGVGLLGLGVVTPDLLNIEVGGTVLAAVRQLEAHTAPPDAARLTPRPPESGVGDALITPSPAAPPSTAVPQRSIVFEDVGFRYPGSDSWVLRHLDLTVPAGTSLAVVGVNGAGKTTLAKLLCGLYEPTEGRVLVDGTDIRDLPPGTWWNCCAALFQDWVRWRLPLRDNVALGAPQRPASEQELAAVARTVGLDEVLGALPDGWSTVLSREYGGVDLSGGQWQRVGLARALWALSAGGTTLVLDEPSSALDVRGETELYDLLLAAAEGRTIVLVSHRFSTVRHADTIVVLADGAVAESGSHKELMDRGGRYARMFTVQADRYVERGEDR